MRFRLSVLVGVLASVVLSLAALPAFAQGHEGGEATLVLPDLAKVSFLGMDGHSLLLSGLVVCVLGLVFGLVIYGQLKNMAVHGAMREISELIYATCKTYLGTQLKFILVLELFIGTIMVVYFGLLQHIATFSGPVLATGLAPKQRHWLTGEGENGGLARRVQNGLPTLGSFDGVAGSIDSQVRNGPQRGQLFDRLMGRTILAKADGVVRHDEDRPDLHQCRKADRRAAIVREAEEGAPIRDQTAAQRDAGGHAAYEDGGCLQQGAGNPLLIAEGPA